MESLADFLGVRGAAPAAPAPAAPAPTSYGEELSGKQFSEAVLRSWEFRRYVVDTLTLGTIPPAVLCRLMDHGWGKPPDHLKVEGLQNNLEELTVEQLEQRALFLAEVARTMREREDAGGGAARGASVH